MNRLMRISLIVVGSVSLLVAMGFALQMPWATGIWPIESGRLSNIFVASIIAAIGAPMVWIGLSGEMRAMAGGAINLFVTNLGFAIFSFMLYAANPQASLLAFGIITLLVASACIPLYRYARPLAFQDRRPMPGWVRGSFIVFAITLLATATALILRLPNIFPWPISPENSVMYGLIFLGAVCYFVYALIFPVWGNVKGQLLGFLAYDLVLIVPFILHFQSVRPEMRVSLVVYTSVLTYSGLLAIYYLFLNPATRLNLARKPAVAAVSRTG